MLSLEGITIWVNNGLNATFNPAVALLIQFLIVGLMAIILFAILGLVLVFMERKVSAFMQIRLGPNRVGPQGIFQTLADTLKLVMKEGLTPDGADKFLFNLAPYVVMIVAMLILAPIAFAKGFQMWDINIGVLYISAVSSISVIGILMAGWASNNKYSLLGAMRSGAQIVSYELSAGLAILSVVILSGSLSISDIIASQQNGWWIFKGHIPAVISFVIFMIAVTAETNRAPFDLAEAESELTAGFHTEYSGMKFALFFLAEYANVIVSSAMITTLYLGGWQFPYLQDFGLPPMLVSILQILTFTAKVTFLVLFFIWVRWTVPRFRYDQLMNLGWKVMLPLGIANLVVTAIVILLMRT